MSRSPSIRITKGLLVPWARAAAPTTTLICQSGGYLTFSCPASSFLPSSTSSLPRTPLTPSPVVSWVQMSSAFPFACNFQRFSSMPLSNNDPHNVSSSRIHPPVLPSSRPLLFLPSNLSVFTLTIHMLNLITITTDGRDYSTPPVMTGTVATCSSTPPVPSRIITTRSASATNSHPHRFDPIKASKLRAYDKRFRSASSDAKPPRAELAQPSSSFHPQVPAQDRLASWSSPYADSARALARQELAPSLLDRADATALDGLAPNTRSSYAAGLLRFTQFCDDWQIPELKRMPASLNLLAAFASCYTGFYSGKTIGSWLSGLRCPLGW
jgi:hypothetical protein